VVGSALDGAASLAGVGSVGSSVMQTSMPTLAADTLDGYWKFAGSHATGHATEGRPGHSQGSPRSRPGSRAKLNR
jgi:hypothetical protein